MKSVSVLFTSPLEDSCILSPNFSHFSFERIIYNQLSSYLSENDISYQSGLSLNVTALLEVTDNGAFNIDRGSVIAVVFLDLKKAFDTVNHPILLSKLYSYGVKGNAYGLLSSYLDNRTQRPAVDSVLSNSCTFTCGTPHGTISYNMSIKCSLSLSYVSSSFINSPRFWFERELTTELMWWASASWNTILGPSLFLLYINDLPNCLSNSQPRMSADDTHLTYADEGHLLYWGFLKSALVKS